MPLSVNRISLTLNPQAEATSAMRWSYFWKATAVITAVALTALAAFAVGWTALFLEEHLSIVTLMSLFSIPPSYQIFSHLWARGAVRDKQARIAGKVAQHWLALTGTKLKEVCDSNKIDIPKNDTDVYRRAYAEFLYQGQKVGRNKEKIESLKKDFSATASEPVDLLVNGKTQKVSPKSYTIAMANSTSPVFKAITSERAKLLEYEKKLVVSKFNQAHLLYFMQNSESKKRFTDVATPRFPDLSTQELARKFGDPSTDVCLQTKQKNYTYQQIMDADIQTLTKEIFSGTGTE